MTDAVRPQLLTKRPDQVGIFREALHENCASAFERGGGISHLLLGIDEGRSRCLRIAVRLGQQQVGQRLKACFLRDLGLGAALRLIGQVNILKTTLAVGGHDGGLQGRIKLTLLADRVEDDGAAVFELPQIGQALFQRAQLRIVEPAGCFLAVTRDERNGSSSIEQRHGRFNLLVPERPALPRFSDEWFLPRPHLLLRTATHKPGRQGRGIWATKNRFFNPCMTAFTRCARRKFVVDAAASAASTYSGYKHRIMREN